MCGYTYTYIHGVGDDIDNTMKRMKNKINYDLRRD